ncbi:hypothetical protein B0O99DRAFT_648139 [Bisporella sp. PMI_857]|nr:hypothetical protein B0O99DRAFT_648139 [Bisporella sp. PMI_857]
MLYGIISFSSLSFDPKEDIPDLSGKVIFITGGNAGLGKETILQISKHNPAHIYLSARTQSKAESAIESIKSTFSDPNECPPITFIECDLSSLPSVVSAAKEFLSKEKRLDRLFLNAGVMGIPAEVTGQGYEVHFGTNHMGHALLTKLLLPTLLRTAEEGNDQGQKNDVRVISLTSAGHAGVFGVSFDKLKTPMDSYMTSTLVRYAQSKLANLLYAKELARRYPSLTSAAVHPGIVRTDLWDTTVTWPGLGHIVKLAKSVFYTSVEGGAKNQLWAGTAAGVKSGEYYTPIGVTGQGTRVSNDAELATRLWDWTEKELEGYTL